MRLLSNLHVKGKPAVFPYHAIRRQSHYFIYRPRMLVCFVRFCLILLTIYSYCYARSVLCILFHCVVSCIVCV
jgi:hypothetical protein